MPFAPEYISNVLNENFEDAKTLFLSPLLAIHHAHLVMLARTGIVPRDAAREIHDALTRISPVDVCAVQYDGSCEDLFYFVERLLVQACGEDAAGQLHTARSRNDIDMTMYRMRQREFILGLLGATVELRRTLTATAGRHRETIFAAHTHTQPAQPTTVAHYLLAVVEQLERDARRLMAAFATVNVCPLGACAITGTGFPVDRQMTSDLLGFDAPTVNTYGSIATVDYLLEGAAAVAIALTGVGRVLQDLLLWCTPEFGYLRLAEGFVQSSSIMPQKRNPVALEHARAIGSKAVGQASAIVTAVHNTPFGDVVDTEDDLQPLVYSMFKDAARAVNLVAAAMRDADFDRAAMAARAGRHWTTVTELADTLVRECGVPFRTAHRIAARFVAERTADASASAAASLDRIAHEVRGSAIGWSDEALAHILSPERFIAVRSTLGGPAPAETGRALEVSREKLQKDDAWRNAATSRLKEAEERLKRACEEL
jgi:argininosuccinate lyase